MLTVDKFSTISARFNKNLLDLFKFNKTRINEILEIIYYGTIYMILSYSLGHFLNNIFPKF